MRTKLLLRTFLFTALLLLAAYVMARAWNLSFTHDESLSYSIFKHNSIWETTANNHPLNTFLMKAFSRLFGEHEFILRLPNVLAFLLYIFFAMRIFRDSKSSIMIIAGPLLLVLNPFLLDFFSLARGYGISLGLMAGSLYFSLVLANRDDGFVRTYLHRVLALVFAIFATAANFGMINLLIALMLLFLAEFLSSRSLRILLLSKQYLIINIMLLVAIAFSMRFFLSQLMALREAGQLYFGGGNLLHNTVASLVHQTMYFTQYTEAEHKIMKYSVVLMYFVFIVTAMVKWKPFSPFFRITFLTTAIITGLIIEHTLFGALYPMGRTALYFIPLFLLMFCFWLDEVIPPSGKIRNIVHATPLVLLTLLFAFHLFRNTSLNYTRSWDYDANTRKVMLMIKDITEGESFGSRLFTISNHWLFQPSVWYYISSRDIHHLSPPERREFIVDADFLYVQDIDSIAADTSRYVLLKRYDDTKTTLFARKAD